MFVATTRVDVFRDMNASDTNAWGDEVETGGPRPWKADVPASVVMSSFSRRTAGDLNEDRVVSYTIRVAGNSGVREDDRLRDRADGSWYLVMESSYPQSLVGPASGRLVARRVGPAA